MRLLLVGYGRMGKLVERLAPEYGFEVVGRLDDTNNIGGVGIPSAPDADVAIEFSVPDAVPEHLPTLAARRMNVVIGPHGRHDHQTNMTPNASARHLGRARCGPRNGSTGKRDGLRFKTYWGLRKGFGL